MSRFFSTDANQKQIISDLQLVGVQVWDFSKVGQGCPDLLTWYRSFCLIEVKMESNARIKKTQMKFIGQCRGSVGFAETFAEAERLAKNPAGYALSGAIKERIAAFEVTFKQKEMRFETFKREIGL